MRNPECGKRIKRLCMIYALLAAFGILCVFLHTKFGLGIPCVFHVITGLNCPSCGITRMAVELLKGNFYGAYCLNRLMFISLPAFAFYIIRSSIRYVKHGECTFSRMDNTVFVVYIVCAVLFGIVRNIDVIIK